MIKIFSCCMIFNLFGLVSFAQDSPFRPGQWVEDSFLAASKQAGRNRPILFDFKGHKEELPPIAPGSASKDGDAALSMLGSWYPGDYFHHDETFYCNASKTEGAQNELLTSALFRKEKSAWVQVGKLSRPRQEGRIRFYPVDNDRFLGISKDPVQLSKDKRADSTFSLFKLDESGEFSFDRSLALDEKRLLKVDRSTLFIEALSALSKDRLLFVLPRLGLYWLFSLENGQIRKSGSIYELKDEHFTRKDYPSVVIGIQPQRDGTFLLAVRVPEVLTQGLGSLAEVKQVETLAGRTDPENLKKAVDLWMNRQSESVRRFPFIRWLEMSATGTVHHLDPAPFGVKEMLNNWDELRKFAFAPLPNGDLMSVEPDFLALEKVGAKPAPKH